MAELTKEQTLQVEQIVKDSIADVIKSELESYHLRNPHICPIPDIVAPEIGHLMGVVVDLGDGDMRRGVEAFRTHSAFIKRLLGYNKRVSDIIAKIIIGGIIALVLGLIGLSIKETLIKWLLK